MGFELASHRGFESQMHHRDTYLYELYEVLLGTHLKFKLCALTFSYHPFEFEFVDVCLF
jgi:hypothetical protein